MNKSGVIALSLIIIVYVKCVITLRKYIPMKVPAQIWKKYFVICTQNCFVSSLVLSSKPIVKRSNVWKTEKIWDDILLTFYALCVDIDVDIVRG